MHDERDTRDTIFRGSIREMYMSAGIIPSRDNFGCKALTRCSQHARRRFNTGNWAFVGSDYGAARVNDLRARILFVAMDIGGYGEADQWQFAYAQQSFRESAELPKNPHMGGVALIMKRLVDDKDPHVIAGQCAVTNAVKCVELTDTMSTKPTSTMILECSHHLNEEIRVLRPDIIITQGAHPGTTVARLLQPVKSLAQFEGHGRIATVGVGCGIVLLTTPHPARQSGLKWSKGILPQFFLDAIDRARLELVIVLRTRRIGIEPQA